MEFFASSARTSKFPWNSLYIIQYLAKNRGGGERISNKSNPIVISQKILFVEKKLLNTGWRVGRGELHAHCKNGDKINSFLVIRAYLFEISNLQHYKMLQKMRELHTKFTISCSKIFLEIEKYNPYFKNISCKKKVAKKEGGISTE